MPDNLEKGRRRKLGGAHEDNAHLARPIAPARPRVKTSSPVVALEIRCKLGSTATSDIPARNASMITPKRNPNSTPSGSLELIVRVYYEDTDFSGRVYHASYLRFLERGRTEWLRAQGFEQKELAADAAMVLAVRRLEIDYLRPALMDDLLTIETKIAAVGGATVDFRQSVVRGEETIVNALVSVVALSSGRPMRLPRDMRARFSVQM
ncbi:MAG: tol-pal system-associated acyl-CoA thioesterase [Roseiarcus sp.]